jgi:hypothetical protein
MNQVFVIDRPVLLRAGEVLDLSGAEVHRTAGGALQLPLADELAGVEVFGERLRAASTQVVSVAALAAKE